jgi:hypothetical protein
MCNIVKVAIVLGILTLAAVAADNRDSVVITFKDGHQQSFPLSDVARIQFKTPTKTTAVALPVPSSGSAGHFMGKWKVGDGQGHSFTITLDRSGSATKSIGSTHGTWKAENGEAHISWDDGWHDAIRKAGNNYEKVAFGPGKTFSDQPDNVTDAKSLEPI